MGKAGLTAPGSKSAARAQHLYAATQRSNSAQASPQQSATRLRHEARPVGLLLLGAGLWAGGSQRRAGSGHSRQRCLGHDNERRLIHGAGGQRDLVGCGGGRRGLCLGPQSLRLERLEAWGRKLQLVERKRCIILPRIKAVRDGTSVLSSTPAAAAGYDGETWIRLRQLHSRTQALAPNSITSSLKLIDPRLILLPASRPSHPRSQPLWAAPATSHPAGRGQARGGCL